MTNLGGGDNSDPFMRELFGAEVDMHLPVLSEGLLALEKGRAGKEEIDSMMRAAHSIKGAARVVGIERAVGVAHIMEDCFTAAKQGRITLSSDAVDTLLQGVDVLQRICSPQPDAELTDDAIESLLARIAAVRDRTAASPAPLPPAPLRASSFVSAVAAPAEAAEPRIVLPARCEGTAAESLRAEMWSALDRGSRRIVLDFRTVERLTVMQLALLVSFARDIASVAPGAIVEAVGVAGPVEAVLRVVGIDMPVVPAHA